MSSNRLMYDMDTTLLDFAQRMDLNYYIMSGDKYYNDNKCRIEKGIVSGTDVSHISGNIIDLESDLRGITRKASHFPGNQHMSKCSIGDINNCQPENILIKGNASTKERTIDTTMKHLNECELIDYKPIQKLPNSLDHYIKK